MRKVTARLIRGRGLAPSMTGGKSGNKQILTDLIALQQD
jgi:hypothetical protein